MSRQSELRGWDLCLWSVTLGLLVVVTLEGILWTLTRVFVLNFDVAGPNATMLLFLLLAAGWSLGALARTNPSPARTYAACGGLLAGGFLGSLANDPLLAGLGAIVMVTAATPPLATLAGALREDIAGGVAVGVLVFVGLRVALVTASPYATTLGRVLFGGVVVAAAGLLGGLALVERHPETDWTAIGSAPAPLLVLLLVGAGYLAQPWTLARWALRPYWLSVVSVVVGAVAGSILVWARDAPDEREVLGWSVLLLTAVAALLWGRTRLTSVAAAPAWASALVLLAAGTKRASKRHTTKSGHRTVWGLQLLALVALFLSTAATHWAFLPAPLDRLRGLGTASLFGLHGAFLLAVAVCLRGSPVRTATGVDRSRRSLLGAAPTALVPLGALLGRGRDPGVEGPRDGTRVRVMTLNLHAFFGEDGREYNLAAAADLIDDDGADVVAVCESDGLRPTVGHVDGLRWLASRLGYHAAFGAATRRRSYGVGLLSRWPIETVDVLDISTEQSLTRVALVATVRTPDGSLPVISTHLSVGADGGQDARRTQIRRIVDRSAAFDRGVAMGDFNVEPDQPEYDRLTAAFTDAWAAADERSGTPATYTPGDPRKRIDYVFLRGEWTVHEAATKGTSRVSDHRAVVAEVSAESGDDESAPDG